MAFEAFVEIVLSVTVTPSSVEAPVTANVVADILPLTELASRLILPVELSYVNTKLSWPAPTVWSTSSKKLPSFTSPVPPGSSMMSAFESDEIILSLMFRLSIATVPPLNVAVPLAVKPLGNCVTVFVPKPILIVSPLESVSICIRSVPPEFSITNPGVSVLFNAMWKSCPDCAP